MVQMQKREKVVAVRQNKEATDEEKNKPQDPRSSPQQGETCEVASKRQLCMSAPHQHCGDAEGTAGAEPGEAGGAQDRAGGESRMLPGKRVSGISLKERCLAWKLW